MGRPAETMQTQVLLYSETLLERERYTERREKDTQRHTERRRGNRESHTNT